jgi:glyoxylase-like metal-dependent hydrolase (beta-lactamase superfamily II)
VTAPWPLPPALRAPLRPASESWLRDLPWAPVEPALERLQAAPPSRVLAVPAGKLMLFRGEVSSGVSIPILGYLLDTPGVPMVVDCGLRDRWRPAPGAAPSGALGAGSAAASGGPSPARGGTPTGVPEGGSGLPEGAPGLPEDGPAPGMRYRPVLDGPSLAARARELGFAPGRLVCTHLHLDHAGGARELGLPVEASDTEWAEARAGGSGYPAEDLAGLTPKPLTLDPTRPFGPFAASAWLAGGALALDTAGHTPGSISVLVRLASGFALICGDAVYPLLDQPGSPAYLGMLRFRRLLAERADVTLLPAHDTSVQRACGGGAWLGA